MCPSALELLGECMPPPPVTRLFVHRGSISSSSLELSSAVIVRCRCEYAGAAVDPVFEYDAPAVFGLNGDLCDIRVRLMLLLRCDAANSILLRNSLDRRYCSEASSTARVSAYHGIIHTTCNSDSTHMLRYAVDSSL